MVSLGQRRRSRHRPKVGTLQLPITATLPGLCLGARAQRAEPAQGRGGQERCDPASRRQCRAWAAAAESHAFSSQGPRALDGPVERCLWGLTRPRNHHPLTPPTPPTPTQRLRGRVGTPAASPWPFLARVRPMLQSLLSTNLAWGPASPLKIAFWGVGEDAPGRGGDVWQTSHIRFN